MEPLTFYFDRQIGKRIPESLARLAPPVRIKWHEEQRFPCDMPDDKWMNIVGPRRWVVLAQDRKFHVVEAEMDAIRLHKIRCFYLPCASLGRWETLCLFIAKYKKMAELARHEASPFIYEIKPNGRFQKVRI